MFFSFMTVVTAYLSKYFRYKNQLKTQVSTYSLLTEITHYSETGEVLLSIQHVNKHFSVFFNRVKGLAHADQDRTPNAYIRASIISEIYKYPKKRTEIKRNTGNPSFGQIFQVSGNIFSKFSGIIIISIAV